MWSGNSLRRTVHAHLASIHEAAKLVVALLRVARVTVGLAESNGFMTHVTCRLTAKNWDQLRNPKLGNLPLHFLRDTTNQTLGSQASAVVAPYSWNRLQTDVQLANLLSTFCRLLKCLF